MTEVDFKSIQIAREQILDTIYKESTRNIKYTAMMTAIMVIANAIFTFILIGILGK